MLVIEVFEDDMELLPGRSRTMIEVRRKAILRRKGYPCAPGGDPGRLRMQTKE
jgi:hypothetical protein